MRASSFRCEERQPREDRSGPARSGSRDDSAGYSNTIIHGHGQYMQPPPYGYDRPMKDAFAPPQQQHHQPGSHVGYQPSSPSYSQYPRHIQTTTRSQRGLQAVVTSSFSEDETMRHRMMAPEDRYETRERGGHEMNCEGVEERDDVYYNTHDYDRPPVMGGSSYPQPSSRHQQYIQKSYSTGYQTKDGQLKRSYYHHSHPNEEQTFPGQLPADFMPPPVPSKRVKVGGTSRGEIIVTPSRTQHPSEWYTQGSWEAEHDPYNRLDRRQSRTFPPSQNWNHQPAHSPSENSMMHGHARELVEHDRPKMAPSVDETEFAQRVWQPIAPPPQWNSPPSSRAPPPPSSHSHRYWDSKANEAMGQSPRGSFEHQSPYQHGFQQQQQPYYASRSGSDDKMQLVVDAAAATGDHRPVNDNKEGLFLLALPQDRVSLSETLCVVRENIEIFTATQEDVDAPAPGRKHAVTVGQVGLRCIHCRHTTKCSDRVKRAVCYPSSIKRIYRTVIDMKLDHFSQCMFVPEHLKTKLQQLKSVQTRSTGTTMQYFIRAAINIGMEDGPSGVRLTQEGSTRKGDASDMIAFHSPKAGVKGPPTSFVIQRTDSTGSAPSDTSKANDSMMSTESFDSNGSPDSLVSLDKDYEGCVPLALQEDYSNLSPLRCFLRKQVCAFSATEDDIAVRAPTTFSIAVGQIGIGCIHCVRCPPKQRSNRAVCFPFSIGRIYQSVADIQRFHFNECRNLPTDVREQFLELQNASSKGSKGLATRQYWVASARKIGLVDTSRGIRFGRDPSKPEESKAFSLDILAQAAFSVTTADKPLVVSDDKEAIAEFLYVVMEQLQPCRFTEADRNKRRLKDVGCIGVECKHCAGQVDSRKFFWSSVNAVESNFVSVHTHMLECRMVPDSLKEDLIRLKSLRKEQTVALRTGSQKAFFARVWQRLHDDDERCQDDYDSTSPDSESRPMLLGEEEKGEARDVALSHDRERPISEEDTTGNFVSV